MLSVSYAGKMAYSAGKTSGVLSDASGANRGYVLAHCAPPPPMRNMVKQAVRCCRQCGIAGSKRVPLAQLGWY